ncbi:DUF2577 family protein [Oscillibacter sp.]|uniref:DUF2577 family protein n=1 Tax=Oscillibacter sp. TaxID=1945593 RepID=UPI00289D0F5B|nr:DUF2577 family protein [Oscillibacter sp.]
MNGDPFSGLYNLMRTAGQEDAPTGAARLRRGTVLTVSPLTIDVAGTTQEADRFYISHRLIAGHTEKLTVSGSGVSGALDISASCPMGSHDDMSILRGTVALNAVATQDGPVLQAGDEVLLLTTDDQTFYIIDKVVSCA